VRRFAIQHLNQISVPALRLNERMALLATPAGGVDWWFSEPLLADVLDEVAIPPA
jgi:hypothetical protein